MRLQDPVAPVHEFSGSTQPGLEKGEKHNGVRSADLWRLGFMPLPDGPIGVAADC